MAKDSLWIDVLEWLLGLDTIRLGHDAPIRLHWEMAPPPWLIAVSLIVILAVTGLIYRRERTLSLAVLGMAGLRCLLLGLVAVVLCGPILVLERNRTEASHVALLLDTSLSMSRRDCGLDRSQTRLDAARLALLEDNAAPLRALLARNDVRFMTFAGDAEVRAAAVRNPSVHRPDDLGKKVDPQGASRDAINESQTALGAIREELDEAKADGMASDQARAIERGLEQAEGRRLAGIILLSDGRATEPTSLKDALDRARGRQVPVYAVRIGSPRAPRDLELASVKAEEVVYAGDEVVVEVGLRLHGWISPQGSPADLVADTELPSVEVRLLDERSGAVLDAVKSQFERRGSVQYSNAPLGAQGGASSAGTLQEDAEPAVTAATELRIRPKQAGRFKYRVEVETLADDEVGENNAEGLEVTVLDTKLRVLYVEGYPRYEYRYLKNALLRERTVELSVLLLEADERFVQEGTDPIRRFPENAEELKRFDAVIFGDVDPRAGWLSTAQAELLVDFVRNEGGGFGLIAGERYAPQRFRGTGLEKLLPIRIDPEWQGRMEGERLNGFKPVVTAEGRASRLLQMAHGSAIGAAAGRPSGDRDETPLFAELPQLYWFARTLGPKPGGSVLVEHPTQLTRTDRDRSSVAMPLVVTGRYGAGRLFFQATDDTWRWRRLRIGGAPAGELVHDAYWVQMLRMLAPARKASRNPRYAIRPDRRTYAYGQRATVEVEIFDAPLLAQLGDHVTLTLSEDGTPTSAKGMDQASGDIVPSLALMRFDAHRRTPESSVFDVAFTPPRPGRFVLTAEELVSAAPDSPVQPTLRVQPPDLELRYPAAHHESLERMAEATGGRVLELSELAAAFSEIPDRSTRIPEDIVETLSDSKLILMLFGLIITMEWVLRKVFRLL